MGNFQEKVGFIWSVADLLRGDFKAHEYGKVILPFTVIRRLDCVLEPTKEKVLNKVKYLKEKGIKGSAAELVINKIAGQTFHNKSNFTFSKLKDDPNQIGPNLTNYIAGFSERAHEIIQHFGFQEQIRILDEKNLLFLIVSKFCDIDLHPNVVPNFEMGLIFEELIRKFAEQSNETAGEHFTPREVIRLMVNLLFCQDEKILTQRGIVKTLYDPACGTGGMLSVAEEYLHELNPDARLEVFGQELNPESFAICNADMMIKGQDPDNIKYGNSFDKDGFSDSKFDYMLSNPPFGVEWKKVQDFIRSEFDTKGFAGRFGAGLPRIDDGSLLFLQHMISKMKSERNGGRIAIVFNGSPLFTGEAGSGENNIRKWIIENDWLEAIVGLPDQLFYNTGIFTYIWILNNKKPKDRKGKVQLINAVSLFQKMRKSLGNKRNELSEDHISAITQIYGEFKDGEISKIFDNEDFGYRRITVERPLRLNFQITEERLNKLREQTALINLAKSRKKGKEGEKEIQKGVEIQTKILTLLRKLVATKVYKNFQTFKDIIDKIFEEAEMKISAPVKKAIIFVLSEKDESADICVDDDGNAIPDPDLRDNENVPLKEEIPVYFKREVLPHVPDAWIDESKTKIGYEIPFTLHFYKYQVLRPLEVIEAEITQLEKEILQDLKQLSIMKNDN